QVLTASPQVPDRGLAQYWLGTALRVTGDQQLDNAKAHPENKEFLAKAHERLSQAVAPFTAAATTLTDVELAARARAEAAQALIKIGKNKEAAELAKNFATDAALAK